MTEEEELQLLLKFVEIINGNKSTHSFCRNNQL